MATLTQKIADWVTKHGFERVALQFPDALLADAPEILQKVCFALKEQRVFILGDSSSGGGGVDEVGALHYGADCIVRFGHADQQRGGDLPVLFVFGDDDCAESCVADADEVVHRVHGLFAKNGPSEANSPCQKELHAHLLVLCDLPNQHLAERLGNALLESFGKIDSRETKWHVLVATPRLEVLTGDLPVWHDFRWGSLRIADGWWSLGTLALAGAATPPLLKVCGREVRALPQNQEISETLVAGRALAPNSAILYVGPRGSSLERCVLLRYGATCPVWRLERSSAAEVAGNFPLERIFSHSLLQKRYRFVELAKAAGTVGLLLVAAGGPTALGRALARRLELLLSRAGRQSYRLVVGQPTQEKLGNFPDIECYVLLSGPEQFTWEVRDLMVPVCTPFELEVALGARKWTGEYITDLEELLRTAPMTELLSQTSEEGPGVVHTLGATRIRSFENSSVQREVAIGSSSQDRVKPPPASITPGLHGVPWKYSQEESLQNGSPNEPKSPAQ